MSFQDIKKLKDALSKNNNFLIKRPVVYPSFIAFLLAACGGGGGTSNQNQNDTISSNLLSIKTNTLKVLNNQNATVTLTFTEAPVSFGAQNLSVTNGTLIGGGFDTSGLVFTATFVPNGSIDGAAAFITVDNNWQTASGLSLSSSLNSVPILVDTIVPTASFQVSQNENSNLGVMDIIITFSDVPLNFNIANDLNVSSGTLSGGTFDITGKVLSLTYTPAAGQDQSSVETIQLGKEWTDQNGNQPDQILSASLNLNAPVASINISDAVLTSGETATVTITFSAAPNSFNPDQDLVISNGQLIDGKFDESGLIYTATFVPNENVTQHSFIKLGTNWTDGSSVPPNNETFSSTFFIDTVPPSTSISLSDNNLTLGETSTVTITFSEKPNSFNYLTDVSSSNGALSNGVFDSTGLVFTATFTPNSNVLSTNNTITVGVDWSDVSGNVPITSVSSENFSINSVPIVISGNAIKGPLKDAMAFADENGDGIKNDNESSYQTDENGAFDVTVESNNTKIVVKSTENTIDTSSGQKLTDVTLSAPAGSSVISPATTILEAQPNINSSQLAIALGIPTKTADGQSIDLTTFNPFAADADPDVALAVEKAAQQVMVTIKAVSAAAEGAGMSADIAFAKAMESVAEVVSNTAKTIDTSSAEAIAQAEESVKKGEIQKINLSDAEVLNSVTSTVQTKVEEAAASDTTITIDKDALSAVLETTKTAVANVVSSIEAITDTNLNSSASKGIFATITDISSEVKAAAVAEVAQPGSGADLITFTDSSKVTEAAESKENEIKQEEEAKKDGDGSETSGGGGGGGGAPPPIIPKLKFSSTTADGTINSTGTVEIIATFDQYVLSGSTMTVTLDTGATVTLTASTGGYSLTGTYTVGPGQKSDKLTVSSFNTDNIKPATGGKMETPTVESNLSDTSSFVIISDLVAPELSSFSSTSSNGTFNFKGEINITATFNEYIKAGSSFTVTLDTSDTVVLSTDTNSTTLSGTYTVGDGDNSADLNVASYVVGTVKDLSDNALATTTIPSGKNLADNAALVVVTTAPRVTAFSSTTSDGTYVQGESINITATTNEAVQSGSKFEVTLDTGDKVELTAGSTGTSLSGSYTIGAGDNSFDLNVASFTTGTVKDADNNNMVTTFLPTGSNLADSKGIIVDTVGPVVTSSNYVPTTGTLTLVGRNFNWIGAADSSTDVKSKVDATKLTWDIDGDNNTTANKVFANSDISAVYVIDDAVVRVVLTSDAKDALASTTSYGGGNDTLDIVAGLFSNGTKATATDDASDLTILTDSTAPTISTSAGFTSTTADGNYGLGATINITATMSENVVSGSNITVTLGTTDQVVLTAASTGTTLTGTYTVGANDTASDLAISSFVIGSVKDAFDNAMTSTTIPSGKNLSDNAAIVIDTTAPTSTITSAAYNPTSGVITVTGTNLQTLNLSNPTSDNHKSYLDWSKFVWDINGDNTTTADKTFAVSDIDTVVAPNASTLTITLTSTAKSALNGTTGFGAFGGADTLDVTAGFIKDIFGNAATTDARANGTITYSDTTAPTVSTSAGFTSTTSDGNYGLGATINITATMSEAVIQGSSFTVTLGTTDEVVLTQSAGNPSGTTLTGTYTIGANDNASDLSINSFVAGTVTDVYGNTMTSTSIPSGKNLSDNAAIVIDTTAPTATMTSAAYNPTSGVITLTGTNLTTMNVSNPSSDNHKTYLDWSKLVWDINGDNTTTADKTFSISDIDTVVVPNASTMTVTLTSTAKSALNGTTGFGAIGGNDTLDVTAGFVRDIFGNGSTTDARADGTISYSDTTAPTVSTSAGFTSTTSDGNYGLGDDINITATMSESVIQGSSFTVTLSTTDQVVLTAASTGTTLTGTYTIGANDSATDLGINSFVAGTVTDVYGNNMTSTTIPSGKNLSDNAAIAFDTAAPTSTITSAAYNPTSGVITVTGTNLQTLNVTNPSSTNHKSYLDWSKFVWDINGDNTTTADKTFAVSDIDTVVAPNASTLTITLTSTAKSALNGTTGFGAIGGNDTLDVTAGFIKDIGGNAATTDARANGTITYSDTTAPTVSTSAGFTSTTSDGNYGLGDDINITATMSESVIQGSSFTVTLGTTDQIVLTAASTGTTLTGTYTIGANDNSSDLSINSFVAGTVTDVYGNTMTSTSIPSGKNLSDNAAIVIDTTAPTSTITSAAYNPTSGVITVTGTNLQTLNVTNPSSTNHKSYLDWSKFVWDINGDNTTTADKTFAVSDIDTVVAPNASTLTITLTSTAKSALNGTTGFGAFGGADTLDVTAGFIKDIFGNAATTDARANGTITYSDTTAPTVSTSAGFTSTTSDGNYGLGDDINITATMSESVIQGSSFTVTLGTTDQIVLTAASTGTTLTGTYTIGANDNSSDLSINSFVAGTVTDVYGNTMTSTSIPSGKNLSDNAAIVIDTTAPTSTITSAAYNPTSGVITVTGTNLQTLNVTNPSSTNHKSYLDWSKFVWDINGDNTTTADKTFAVSDIDTVVAPNASTLTITLTSTAKSALNGTTGFGAFGGADTLDVTAGFIKDIFGNAATTDARANGTITYSDTTAPTVSTSAGFTSTTSAGSYKSGANINITATMSESVIQGSSFTVTLGTTDQIVLTAASTGTTLTGTYTVSGADSSSDLSIASFVAGTVTDVYGNTMTSTSIPSGKNLSDNAAIVIDNIPVAKASSSVTQSDSGNSTADAADVLVFNFSEAIGNKTTIANIFTSSDTYGATDTRASAAWSNSDKTLSVTLGAGETYGLESISLSGVLDAAGNSSDLNFTFT